MAKKKYIVKEGYLAMGDKNVYRGSKIELDASNPGTKILLDIGAIELLKKEAASGTDDRRN